MCSSDLRTLKWDAPILGDVYTSGGHIEIGKVTAGDVNADTSGGPITIDDVEGDVVADTSGGRITIGNVTGVSDYPPPPRNCQRRERNEAGPSPGARPPARIVDRPSKIML
mgnify:CR=1 FL=1